MYFCIKEHKFGGGFLALGRYTEKFFPLTCRGGESRAKVGLSWGHDWVTSWDLENISPKVSP